MIHFDDVKKIVLELVRLEATNLCKYYVLRDVFGRISVYVEGDIHIEQLRDNIIENIGKEWFNSIQFINKNSLIYNEIINNTIKISDNIFMERDH